MRQGEGPPSPRFSAAVLVRLRAYAESFLGSSYDALMDNMVRQLKPGLSVSRLHRDDFVRFLKLTAFFTRFVRTREVRSERRQRHRGGGHNSLCSMLQPSIQD